MSAKSYAAALDHVVAGSKALLEAVPDDRMDWRPHERSWTLGQLASHVANIPSWTQATMSMSRFDIAGGGEDGDGEGAPAQPVYHSSADLVEALETNAAAARALVENASDEEFASPWTMLVGGEERFTMPKGAVLRGFILDHMIHHRAQLGVYLRLLDVPVPQTFGPTADFPEM